MTYHSPIYWSWQNPKGSFKRIFQNLTKGWNDSDTWDLDGTIANYFLSLPEIEEKIKAGLTLLINEDDIPYSKYLPPWKSLDDLNKIKVDPENKRLLNEYIENREKIIKDTVYYLINNKLYLLKLSHFIVPRLKRFIEVVHGYPSAIYDENDKFEYGFNLWKVYLSRMLASFEYIKEINKDINIQEFPIIVQEGIVLFQQYFRSLWD